MSRSVTLLFLTLCLGSGACGPGDAPRDAATPAADASPTTDAPDATDASHADGDAADARLPASLARLDTYLRGEFDNRAQHDRGFDKLVERHVCPLPGRDAEPGVVWLYVEHVEVLADGRRDAYFTRVNELREVDGVIVSRAYRFAPGHPLATNAYEYNGPRDGCATPDRLGAITASDLQYRAGCDVTFEPDGDARFTATTREGACAIPGGTIGTRATITADGLDTTDTPVIGGVAQPAATFEFRRTAR